MRILLIVGACITVVGILYLVNAKRTKSIDKLTEELIDKKATQDTLYFKSKDGLGNVSMIHDSGIKPSTLKSTNSNDFVIMKLVKYEYNDGVEKILGRPVELAIGQNIYNLVTNIKLTPNQVQEKTDHYVATIDNLWK